MNILETIVAFFFPLCRREGRWVVEYMMLFEHVRTYLARCGLPAIVFLGMVHFFENIGSTIGMILVTPFAFVFGTASVVYVILIWDEWNKS